MASNYPVQIISTWTFIPTGGGYPILLKTHIENFSTFGHYNLRKSLTWASTPQDALTNLTGTIKIRTRACHGIRPILTPFPAMHYTIAGSGNGVIHNSLGDFTGASYQLNGLIS